ncbi:MAG: cell division protein FtsL [Pseudomonadota bacterium]
MSVMRGLPVRRGLTLAAALLFALAISAIALVYTRHQSRQLFIELQELSRERDALNTQYQSLQLEQGAHAAYNRLEERAPTELGLHAPSPEEVYLIGSDGRYWFTGLAPMTEALAAQLAAAQADVDDAAEEQGR